jgi:NAD(P)-dependent dehydrogenase (short-subunit alcohol dehydrogenase family)
MPPIVLVTGASSGIGNACAEVLKGRGHRVYAASRSLSPTDVPYPQLTLDVNDDASVNEAVRAIAEREGRIDVLVNCAGNGIAGSVEDTSIDEARWQFETNFFGTLRMCRAVLPIMRAQKSGRIVNVSSLAGLLAIPYQALYSASKFAVEGLTEALRMEVAQFGVRVVLIEPGNFRTRFTASRRWATAATNPDGPYYTSAHRAVALMEHEEQAGPPPSDVARLVCKVIATPRPKLRYRVGALSERMAVPAKQLLPYALYERALLSHYKLD